MSVNQGVIPSVIIRFLRKGKLDASHPQPAKIVVTAGKIDIISLDDKFPPIQLKASNVTKPKRPAGKTSTWICLDVIQNIDAKFVYVNIQANSRSELDDVYNTLMIASDYFNDDDSFSIDAPVHIPPSKIKKKAVEPTAGGGKSVNTFNNRSAKRKFDKRDVIVIDDVDEPPVKQKAVEKPVPSPEVAQLQQQLKQSEEEFQKLCDVARRDKETLQAKLDYLEKLVDSKDGILKNANNASVEDELKKNVAALMKELEEERKRSNDLHLSDYKRIVELESQLAEEKQNSAVLQQKLDQVEAQLMQQPPTFASCSDLDTATGSLDSQHQPSDDKVVSPEGKPRTPKVEPTVVDSSQPPSDPRPKYQKIDGPENLIVPMLTVDDQYTGIPPKREVTISRLNDNVNKELLTQLARKQKLEPEDVIVFYHPTTKKHLKMALILFRSSNDARLFVDSNKDTKLMGNSMFCRLDPFAAELSFMYQESTRSADLPVLPYLSGMSDLVLSQRREKLIEQIEIRGDIPWRWMW